MTSNIFCLFDLKDSSWTKIITIIKVIFIILHTVEIAIELFHGPVGYFQRAQLEEWRIETPRSTSHPTSDPVKARKHLSFLNSHLMSCLVTVFFYPEVIIL